MFFKNEVVGVADVETEKLIAELRDYFDGKNLNHATAMRAADALERLTAESAEKDAEIKRLKEQVQYNHDCYFSEFAEKNRLQAELDAADAAVASIHTTAADAVPVVRCRECKRKEACICVVCEDGDMIFCAALHRHMNPDDFCSYGVRKEHD